MTDFCHVSPRAFTDELPRTAFEIIDSVTIRLWHRLLTTPANRDERQAMADAYIVAGDARAALVADLDAQAAYDDGRRAGEFDRAWQRTPEHSQTAYNLRRYQGEHEQEAYNRGYYQIGGRP